MSEFLELDASEAIRSLSPSNVGDPGFGCLLAGRTTVDPVVARFLTDSAAYLEINRDAHDGPHHREKISTSMNLARGIKK